MKAYSSAKPDNAQIVDPDVFPRFFMACYLDLTADFDVSTPVEFCANVDPNKVFFRLAWSFPDMNLGRIYQN